MEKVILIFQNGTFEVNLLSLRQSCDASGLFGVTSYSARLSASASIIQLFVETLNGADIKITNESVADL
jgi:hypothetical protein